MRKATPRKTGTNIISNVTQIVFGKSSFQENVNLPNDEYIWKKIRIAMNFSLFSNPTFMLVCLTNMIAFLGIYHPYFYMPDLLVASNYTKEESSYILSASGKHLPTKDIEN